MPDHQVVSRDQWLAARKALLAKEKDFTRARDALSAERRALPWVRVEKTYTFDGPNGPETLGDLFDGRSQLVIYHFMYGPDWQEGCPSCSFWADNFDRIVVHLNHRDVSLAAVSRAPLETLLAYRERMGWSFPWVSSLHCDFNQDFDVSFTPEQLAAGSHTYNYRRGGFGGEEAPGISVFARDEEGDIFHTYSTFGRGLDMLNTAYHYLDLVPKGRDEDGLDFSMAWLRRRDQYED
jgi:predicted dithiol-disulfide oxidoreductase (DUF899 family)